MIKWDNKDIKKRMNWKKFELFFKKKKTRKRIWLDKFSPPTLFEIRNKIPIDRFSKIQQIKYQSENNYNEINKNLLRRSIQYDFETIKLFYNCLYPSKNQPMNVYIKINFDRFKKIMVKVDVLLLGDIKIAFQIAFYFLVPISSGTSMKYDEGQDIFIRNFLYRRANNGTCTQ